MDEKTIARFWQKVDKNGPVPAHLPQLGRCWIWTDRPTTNGYGQLNVRGSRIQAHRLSFFLEHGRWPKPCALHRCDNPPCVRPSHLFEGTQLENARDRETKGRGGSCKIQGELNWNTSLSTPNVVSIRQAALSGETHRSIAERFGVSRNQISNIVRGDTWGHLPDACVAKRSRAAHGKELPQSKLTEESVLKIREMARAGVIQREIAALFGIDRANVSYIVRRKTWAHV